MTYLSDEDRASIGLLVGNGYLTRVGTRELIATVESLIVRHRAAELREAAYEMGESNYLLTPVDSQPFPGQVMSIERWLIDRANLLDPKDGAR